MNLQLMESNMTTQSNTENKNILFLVTGMTPQIITETVWALACDPENTEQWIPNEVHVLTTTQGLNQIESLLFNQKHFEQMINEYDLPQIKFNLDQIYVFQDEQGDDLSDLKTPEDNAHAADMICEKIRGFTENPSVSLHVSMAGGRKTMGFYAGYALSLYGRAQDRLSHVLVSEEFEGIKEFFYKTKDRGFVTDRNAKELNTQDAQIWLANIPFIRMRDAILPKHQLKRDDRFTEVVHKINESYKAVKLQINAHQKTVLVNDQFLIDSLPPREFAMLHWFATLRKNGANGVVAPKIDANSKKVSAEDAAHIQQLTDEYCEYYQDLKSSDLKEFCVDKKFFEAVKSLLKSSLEKALGLELAAKIAITQKNRGLPFYLDLQADAIEIVDTFKTENI